MKLLVAFLMQFLIIFSALIEFAHSHEFDAATDASALTAFADPSADFAVVAPLATHQSPTHQHCLNCHDVGGCAHAFLGAVRVTTSSFESIVSPIASSKSLYVGPHSKGLKRPPIS